jgi:hypothetical protein
MIRRQIVFHFCLGQDVATLGLVLCPAGIVRPLLSASMLLVHRRSQVVHVGFVRRAWRCQGLGRNRRTAAGPIGTLQSRFPNDWRGRRGLNKKAYTPPRRVDRYVSRSIESAKTNPYPRGLAGPEIVEIWGLHGLSYRKTHWKRWGARPPTFSNWFCGRRGPFRPPKLTISGQANTRG